MYLPVILSFYSYFRFSFRDIQKYSSIIQEHTYAFSKLCVASPNSEPLHIPNTKHIQIPRYLHNTILNIFAKAPSRTFDTALLSNFQSHFTVSLTLHIRHIQAYSRFIQPCLVLLRHIKNPGIFPNILLQAYF